MTVIAEKLLATFDELDPNEKQQVAVEILRRTVGTDEIPADTFDELGAELFRAYDAEEAASAGS